METIEFSLFNSVVLYKANLYKYERRAYILPKILKESSCKTLGREIKGFYFDHE